MMSYDRSIINIDINFENEPFTTNKPSRPVVVKKVPKDRITVIQPSVESKRTDTEIEKRVTEVTKFRRNSQSAVSAPLLVKALIKKTCSKLKTIQDVKNENRDIALKPYEKFQWAARVVHVLVSSCMRWRRYKKTSSNKTSTTTQRGSPKRKHSGIGFDAKTFKEKSKLSEDLRAILTSIPKNRTSEQLKKIQRLCRSTRAFMIFPLERELDLAKNVGYERYDNGRVIACQGRRPERFYYVLSGRISKVCSYNLAAGITKMSFGELHQGTTTDPHELYQGDLRNYSLTCKGSVEVLVLDREDFMDLMNTNPDQGLPTDFLRSIELFRSFPMEKFKEEKDAITTKYFARDSVIVKDSCDSPYFYIVKSGRCKVVRQQDVLDVTRASKLPSIIAVNKPPSRAAPGKNPTSLLEISKTMSTSRRDSVLEKARNRNLERRTKSKIEGDGIITDDDEIQVRKREDAEKRLQDPACESDLFKRTSEIDLLRPRDNHQTTKKAIEQHAVCPTRKALLQIATLKSGDLFGIESMMPKVANKISAEVIQEKPDPSARSVILISEGAECVMINKRFFLLNASITTLVQFKALREEYITVEQARHQIQSQQAWNMYKTDMIKDLACKPKRDRYHSR